MSSYLFKKKDKKYLVPTLRKHKNRPNLQTLATI